jgi:ADP-heptose:LPS heptosyltransferase
MHIAVAVGTPVVAIFGPTDPKRKYPPSDDFVIVRKGLECSPCYDGKRVACERLDCLMSVTVDEAFEAAARLLRQKKGIGYAD